MADTQPPMSHEDSIDSQDPNTHPDTKKKSRRPANTAFRQQRLKAWQPILTPKTVLPLFFAIGIIFAPIGGGLLYASAVVQEIIIDYSSCYSDAPTWPTWDALPTDGDKYVSHFTSNSSNGDYKPTSPMWSQNQTGLQDALGNNITSCYLKFGIPNEMKPPVLFYYKLAKFYQNHRRYAKSFNTDQLSGKAVSEKTIHSSDCTPLTTTKVNNVSLPYYPCGIAANSQFNDTFYNLTLQNVPRSSDTERPYNMTKKGISWSSDKKLYGDSKYNWDEVAVPPNWVTKYGTSYNDTNHPDLVNDEEFQVWMRLAGLPTFSKLAQRNDHEVMEHGDYIVRIDHNFDVTEYGGTKSIIISTSTVMGGKNPFLGIAYVVVGGICIVLGALFTVTHLIRPRKLGDHTYLSWNNDGTGGGAATTGRNGVLAGEGRA
ncbi:Meiotically up-regulated protein [Lachnellula hyalina]|uniref:Meiotically up-regulated protein n=1 Tax=Lachnellula hyalina TaxID=1316788 RepID=A0A8H8R657_9HELO|nr:Meiotically up-regulated protein [Lachnellula hyalina]TVY29263.1 Meiotically up-regulated protein [Lachnellula hyalina]